MMMIQECRRRHDDDDLHTHTAHLVFFVVSTLNCWSMITVGSFGSLLSFMFRRARENNELLTDGRRGVCDLSDEKIRNQVKTVGVKHQSRVIARE